MKTIKLLVFAWSYWMVVWVGFAQKDEYTIQYTLDNGISDTTVSELYTDEKTKKTFFFDNCQRIYPVNLKNARLTTFENKTLDATLLDGNLYFQNTVGERISTYKLSPDGDTSYNIKKLRFVKNGDDISYAYSRKNMKKLVGDNPKALKTMKKYFAWRNSQLGLIGVGIGVAVVTAPTIVYPAASVLLFGGAVTFMDVPVKKVFYKSLDQYNSELLK